MAKIGPNWRHQMKGSPEVAAVEAASKARLELDSVLGRIDSSSTEDIGDDVDRAVAHVDVAVSMNEYIYIISFYSTLSNNYIYNFNSNIHFEQFTNNNRLQLFYNVWS